jgi:hypothetical protein
MLTCLDATAWKPRYVAATAAALSAEPTLIPQSSDFAVALAASLALHQPRSQFVRGASQKPLTTNDDNSMCA